MLKSCFLWACASEGQNTILTLLAHDLLLREGRLAEKSSGNVCAAFMRSTVPLRNLPIAPGDYCKEVCKCFLTFPEFTVCRIQKFRNFFRSCPANTSTLVLKYLPIFLLGRLPLLDKGMPLAFFFFFCFHKHIFK